MVVPVHEVKRFMVQAMVAVGTAWEHAQQMADVLVAADYRGHYSHGLNRLGEWRSLRAFRDSYFSSYRHSQIIGNGVLSRSPMQLIKHRYRNNIPTYI